MIWVVFVTCYGDGWGDCRCGCCGRFGFTDLDWADLYGS